MGFTSEIFLFIFMPISIIVYLFFNRFCSIKVSNIVLIVLNCIFYIWTGLNTFVLFMLLIAFVYLFGQIICYVNVLQEKQTNSKKWVYFACILGVIYLFATKYLFVLCELINKLFSMQLTITSIIAPLGISFVIFESISYIVDVYRGDAEPGTILDVTLFLSLYPKLVSGPIVLWKDFNKQIYNRQTNVNDISEGINRVIIGFAKKAILADTFGARIILINNGMAGSGVDTITIWLRAVLYFFQVYYDFSGYSDIAIGLCRIFGFSLKENFNFPYISCSITEFWRRWHISLGTWFREYVYIPLGGNRKGNVYLNLFIVFLLTGIWHGANLTFLVWGVLNGLFVIVERLVKGKTWYKKIPSLIKWIFTTTLVYLAWVIFMSDNLIDSINNFKLMFSASDLSMPNYTWEYYLSKKIIILLIVAFVGLVISAFPINKWAKKILESNIGLVIQKIIYLVIFIVSILFIVNSSYSPFLYFQF